VSRSPHPAGGHAAADPSPLSAKRRRRIGLGVVACLTVGVAAIALAAKREPAFYRSRAATGGDGVAAATDPAVLGRRLVSKLSALRADFLRPGPWETVVAEAELNAWLATDLPQNHAALLPAGLSAPRVALEPRRVQAGARLGGFVVSVDADVVLRDVNQIGITITAARLGSLPLPRGPVVQEVARRIGGLGLPTDLRRAAGGTVLVVSLPAAYDPAAPSHRLESLALRNGELVVAGTTRAAADPRHAGNAAR